MEFKCLVLFHSLLTQKATWPKSKLSKPKEAESPFLIFSTVITVTTFWRVLSVWPRHLLGGPWLPDFGERDAVHRPFVVTCDCAGLRLCSCFAFIEFSSSFLFLWMTGSSPLFSHHMLSGFIGLQDHYCASESCNSSEIGEAMKKWAQTLGGVRTHPRHLKPW